MQQQRRIQNQITKAWAQRITGSTHYVWETKLKKLRIKLKTWARENETQKKRKKELQTKMDSMQKEKKNKEEEKQDYLKEKDIFWEIHRENRKEEEEMRLKSRSLWLNARDKNTTFFHNTMKIR